MNCQRLSNKSVCSHGQSRAPLPTRSRRRSIVVQAEESPSVGARALSALPYILPMCDGLRYGQFLFLQYPIFSTALQPVFVISKLYYSIPLASLVVFFGLYFGIVNNQRLDRSIRFNALQAVLLDILLLIPSLLGRNGGTPTDGFLLQLYISGYNTIFLFVFAAFAYGVGASLAGSTPRIPLVSSAAEQQLGGF